jgi:2,5-diketo-D-gluconate reductase B
MLGVRRFPFRPRRPTLPHQETDMKHIDLPGGGRMPVLGLGTWQMRGRDCAEAVKRALRMGYHHIDTAEMYANEAAVGDGVRESGVPRADLFVTTKIWTNHFRAPDATRAAEESLRNLRMDHVDLLLMHWPNEDVPLAETLGALAELLKHGKTKAIGVSNFPRDLLKEAIAACPAPIACDQVRYHPGISQKPLLGFARERNIAITAYSPLGKGEVAHDRTLTSIGTKHGKTAAQIALKWLVEQDGVSAIPKASREENLRANLEIFDFELDEADRGKIAAMA